MIVDQTAAARPADPHRVREWLAGQRVFISSAMADTADERAAVAEAITAAGAMPVWFEEFGRDADAEEAYLAELESSSTYIAILNEQYGRPNPPDGDSATEIEFRRARERGLRTNVYTTADAPNREGALSRFIERARFFVTTENYVNGSDLAARVARRLERLAAEALSPWVKLGDYVFRADEITEDGRTVTITARVSDEIAHQLQTAAGKRFGHERMRFTTRDRVLDGDLDRVERTTRAGGADELRIELRNVGPPQSDSMRAGTSGYSADDLIELGARHLLLLEDMPAQIGMLDFLTDTGIDVDDLREAFDLPNEIAEQVARLVVVEGLVGHGHAGRLLTLAVGPRFDQTRRIELAWEEPRAYVNVEPARREVAGDWRRPAASG